LSDLGLAHAWKMGEADYKGSLIYTFYFDFQIVVYCGQGIDRGRKHILPVPFFICVWIFSFRCIGHVNFAKSFISFIDNDCTIVYINLNQIRGLYPFSTYFSNILQLFGP